MRKTRLIILPGARCLTQMCCLLIYLSCPQIGAKHREKLDIARDDLYFETIRELHGNKEPPGDYDEMCYIGDSHITCNRTRSDYYKDKNNIICSKEVLDEHIGTIIQNNDVVTQNKITSDGIQAVTNSRTNANEVRRNLNKMDRHARTGRRVDLQNRKIPTSGLRERDVRNVIESNKQTTIQSTRKLNSEDRERYSKIIQQKGVRTNSENSERFINRFDNAYRRDMVRSQSELINNRRNTYTRSMRNVDRVSRKMETRLNVENDATQTFRKDLLENLRETQTSHDRRVLKLPSIQAERRSTRDNRDTRRFDRQTSRYQRVSNQLDNRRRSSDITFERLSRNNARMHSNEIGRNREVNNLRRYSREVDRVILDREDRENNKQFYRRENQRGEMRSLGNEIRLLRSDDQRRVRLSRDQTRDVKSINRQNNENRMERSRLNTNEERTNGVIRMYRDENSRVGVTNRLSRRDSQTRFNVMSRNTPIYQAREPDRNNNRDRSNEFRGQYERINFADVNAGLEIRNDRRNQDRNVDRQMRRKRDNTINSEDRNLKERENNFRREGVRDSIRDDYNRRILSEHNYQARTHRNIETRTLKTSPERRQSVERRSVRYNNLYNSRQTHDSTEINRLSDRRRDHMMLRTENSLRRLSNNEMLRKNYEQTNRSFRLRNFDNRIDTIDMNRRQSRQEDSASRRMINTRLSSVRHANIRNSETRLTNPETDRQRLSLERSAHNSFEDSLNQDYNEARKLRISRTVKRDISRRNTQAERLNVASSRARNIPTESRDSRRLSVRVAVPEYNLASRRSGSSIREAYEKERRLNNVLNMPTEYHNLKNYLYKNVRIEHLDRTVDSRRSIYRDNYRSEKDYNIRHVLDRENLQQRKMNIRKTVTNHRYVEPKKNVRDEMESALIIGQYDYTSEYKKSPLDENAFITISNEISDVISPVQSNDTSLKYTPISLDSLLLEDLEKDDIIIDHETYLPNVDTKDTKWATLSTLISNTLTTKWTMNGDAKAAVVGSLAFIALTNKVKLL